MTMTTTQVSMRLLMIATLLLLLLPVGTATAQMPPMGPLCRLAEAPPPPDPDAPKSTEPPYESHARQQCENELAKDHAWWFNLEARLRAQIHRQAAKEISTNNRHVVLAYGAMWLAAIGFVVVMWRRQQALKAEIARLARELDKAAKA